MTVTKGFITIVLMAAVGWGILYLTRDKVPEHTFFHTQNVQTYSLSYRQKIFNFALSPLPKPSYVRLEATLRLSVEEIGHKNVRTIMQLEDVNLTLLPANRALSRALSSYYSKPVKVLFSPEGKILELVFPGLDENYVGYRELLRQLEMIWHNKADYTVEQEDGLGRYRAQYSYIQKQLKRHKTAYVNTREKQKVVVYTSEATAGVQENVNWYAAFESREKLRILEENQKVLQTDTTISLMLRSSADTPSDDLEDSFFEAAAENDTNVFERVEARQNREAFKRHHEDLSTLVADVQNAPKDIAGYTRLQAYLKLYPEKIEELYNIIDASDDIAAQGLLALLDDLGMPQSRRLLAQIATDDAMQQINRVRAVIALSGQQGASSEVTASLVELIDDRSTPEHAELSDTALLAVGSISRKDETFSEENRYILENALQRAESYGEKKAALLAIRNAGTESFKETVLPFTGDSDPRLRRLSISMLAAYKDDDIREALRRQYAVEKDPDLREVLKKLVENDE